MTDPVGGESNLDLAFLARDANRAVFTPLLDGRGEWSAGAFDDAEVVMDLLGVRATVVTIESLLADTSERRDDESADREDRAHVAVLSHLARCG